MVLSRRFLCCAIKQHRMENVLPPMTDFSHLGVRDDLMDVCIGRCPITLRAAQSLSIAAR